MKHHLIAFCTSIMLSAGAWAAPSILDIKHSITDDNVVPPESFETRTRELAENFYLKNYVVPDQSNDVTNTGTAAEYEERLKRLPTEIEMPYNSIVGKFIDMYLTKKRSLVADMLALHNYYGRIFLEELEKQGMPTELQYLPVIESALNPNAVSKAGASGLWQFMPTTAVGLGMEVNSLIDERRDPRLSSRYAVLYLKQLYEIYHDWSLAIAAYNCGPGNVNKALRRAGGDNPTSKMDFWEIYSFLPSETRGYVPAFIAANYVMNYYPAHGIRPTIVKRQLVTDTISVNKYVHFNQIASILNIPVDEIRMLNPQFRKDIVPGDYRPYTLTLPYQQCLSYLLSEQRILDFDSELYARRSNVEPGESSSRPAVVNDNGDANLTMSSKQSLNAENNVDVNVPTPELSAVTHVVKRGESIREIAQHYGVSATDIKRWNDLRRGKVKEGDTLRIEVAANVDISNATVTPAREVAQAPAPAPAEEKAAPAPAPAAKTKPAEKEKPAAKSKSTAAAPRSHTVQSGENLMRIAMKYGTTVEEIQKLNGMKSSTFIRAGQTLKIPAASAKPSAKKSSKKKK
ncbi:MAG: transglycosylase SLT domain-containing protein [Duncaniella sp.]|nr:transglycosylase SLT domain-containing protein [Duncaniella sp.]